jgi:hypothetical protein
LRERAVTHRAANNVLVGKRCKPDSIRRELLPMAFDPNPTAGPPQPMAFHISGRRSWTFDPMTPHPNISRSVPLPVTLDPDVSWTWRDGLRFHSHRGRRLGDKDFARCRTSRCNFTRDSCRCCDRRRFLGTANKREWQQRRHPNPYSHNVPFCII